jgi:hypothetical protein
MEIKWPIVASFTLLTLLVVWAVREQNAIVSLLSNLGRMGPEHPTDERFYSLMVFSLLLVVIVALVRIFVDHRSQE